MFDDILKAVTQPVRDVVDVVEGLTEGELRSKAAARLGTEVVSGMAIGAVIAFLNDED